MKQTVILLALLTLIALAACESDTKNETYSNSIESESNPANTLSTQDWPENFQIGREATEEEIAAKDIDVKPDGEGLPEGAGTVAIGRTLYQAKCAACHGETGVEGPENVLVSNDEDSRKGSKKTKAIGNYWPYATTLYDYINRAMPFNAPGSLKSDEVYSLTAYLLYRNKIIAADEILTADNLPKIEMPAKSKFVNDDRRGGREVK